MVSNFQIDKIKIQSIYHRTMAELSLPFSIESSRVVILTGAGISAESGIKTFRDNDGLWETHKVEDVAIPDWSHLGVTVHPTVKLTWDLIQQSDKDENNTKVETHTPQEIQSLKQSFATNVDASQFPPAVVRTGNKEEGSKPYKLKYGFGRVDALSELTDGWFFTVLEGTEDALDDVKAQNIQKLSARYPEGHFNSYFSENRRIDDL